MGLLILDISCEWVVLCVWLLFLNIVFSSFIPVLDRVSPSLLFVAQ